MKKLLACLVVVLAAPVLLSGCEKKDEKKEEAKATAKKAEKKAEPVYDFTCKVFVRKKVQVYEGKATVEGDEAAAKEQAVKAACEKLPEADRLSCSDDARFEKSLATGSLTSDGKTTYTVTAKVKEKFPELTGKGSSRKDHDEACAAAIADACKLGGAEGDCVKAGTHEHKGYSKSKSLVQK